MTPFEEEILKIANEKSGHKPESLLKIEANYVIKNFILIRYLRRHDHTLNTRAKLLLQFIGAKERFHALRMRLLIKEPSTEKLLSKFHLNLQSSAGKIEDGLQGMKTLQQSSQKLVKSQNDILRNAKKSLRLSNTLCNLS